MTTLSKVLRLGAFLVLAYLLLKFVPVYIAAFRFDSAVAHFAREGATAGSSHAQIRDNIVWKAKQLELPVRPQDIQIEIFSQDKIVVATVNYQVAVDLGTNVVTLRFRPHARERALPTAEDLERVKVP